MRQAVAICYVAAHLLLAPSATNAQTADLRNFGHPGCSEVTRIAQDPALREYLVRWVDERLASSQFLRLADSYRPGPETDPVVGLDLDLLGLRYEDIDIELNRTEEARIELSEDRFSDARTDAGAILSVTIRYGRARLIIRRNEESLGLHWAGTEELSKLQSVDGVVYFYCD